MIPNDSPGWWFITLDVTLFPVAVLFLYLILREARRLVHATWAMVSQLQAMRRELPVASLPAAPLIDESTVPVHRPVVNSMFGR